MITIDKELLISDRCEFGTLFNNLNLMGYGLEIGVFEGIFSETLRNKWKGKTLHLVDRWVHDNGYIDVSNKSNEEFEEMFLNVNKKFLHDPSVITHRMLSLDASRLFSDNFFDWIYIDADHSYDACSNDLRNWYNKLKSVEFILDMIT